MELLFFLAYIFDGLIVGLLVFCVMGWMIGDKPLARLIKLLFGVAAGIGYWLLCVYMHGSDSSSMSMGLFLFVVFAPIALLAILWLINYMFEGKK